MACTDVYSTSETLLNGTKVDDFVTLTVTFTLKIAFLDFVAALGIIVLKWVIDLLKVMESLIYIL